MARDFDGVDDNIDFGDINDLDGVAQLSAAIWWWQDAGQAFTSALGKISADTNSGWSIQHPGATGYGTSTTTDFLLTIRNAGVFGGFTEINPSTGAWHHVVLVYDGSLTGDSNRLKCWVDGTQQTLDFGVHPGIPATIAATTTSLIVGRENTATSIDGKLEEPAVWLRVITIAEITALNARASALLFPTNLRVYSPLYGVASPEPNEVGAETGTVTGAAQSTHLTIYFFQKNQFALSDNTAVSSGLGGVLIE